VYFICIGLQERARFRRLYPASQTGSYDPHYHWRGERNEERYVDDILSRLIEVRVGPMEQAAQCACVIKAPSVRSGMPCAANNAVDTILPYNPWYGTYTEHRLQAMSVDDSGDVQVIRPVSTVLAMPLVHVEEEWNNEERLHQHATAEMAAMSSGDEVNFSNLVVLNLNIHTLSSELYKDKDSTVILKTPERVSSLQKPAAVAGKISTATGKSCEPTITQQRTTADGEFSVTAETTDLVTSVEKSSEIATNNRRANCKLSERETLARESQIAASKTAGLKTTQPDHASSDRPSKCKNSRPSLASKTTETNTLLKQSPATADKVTDRRERSVVQAIESLDRNDHTKSSRCCEQSKKLARSVAEDPVGTDQSTNTAEQEQFSLNDLVESMLTLQPLTHDQDRSTVMSLQDTEKVRDEAAGLMSAEKDVGSEEKKSKAVPGVHTDDSTLSRGSTDKDMTAVAPDVFVGGNSSPQGIPTDSEVSAFMAGSEHPPKVLDTQPRLHVVDAEMTSLTTAKLTDGNNEQQPDKHDGVSEDQQDAEETVQGNNTNHASDVFASSADKPTISNQTTSDKSFSATSFNGNHARTPTEWWKSLSNVQKPENPRQSENAHENETETKPKTAKHAPVPRPRISVKRIPSVICLFVNNDETDSDSTGRTAEFGENLELVDTDNTTSRDEIKLRRTESVTDLGEEEDMDVDVDEADAAGNAAEVNADDAEGKTDRQSGEMSTSGTDEVEANPHHHHHHHNQQQQQQQWVKTQSESSMERTTSKESQSTVSTVDPCTPTKDADNSTVMTVAAPTQSTADNTGLSYSRDVEEIPDEITTSTSSDNRLSSGGSSHDENERKTTHGEPVTPDSTHSDSNPLSDDDTEESCEFPKSSAGHTASEQKDRRSKRLTKSVRIYHDLSTVIDYSEDDDKAVTTIHLKSARKR